MGETDNELWKAHQDATNKYTYFLLAAAGASIAFALTQTKDAKLSIDQLPLAAAALAWGASFWSGCSLVESLNRHMFLNQLYLEVKAGRNPVVGRSPALSIAAKSTRDEMDIHSRSIRTLGRWQFRLLVAGAVFYIGWHILEMLRRARGEG